MKFNSTNSTPASPPLYRSPSKIKKFSRRKKNFKHSRKRSASGEGRRDRSSNQRSCQFPWNFTRANIDHQLTASSRLEPDSYQFSFQFFPPLFHRHSERPLFFPSPPRPAAEKYAYYGAVNSRFTFRTRERKRGRERRK